MQRLRNQLSSASAIFAKMISRSGLKTTVGRLIPTCGVKPLGTWQWQFQAFWLYSAVEPTSGEQFFWQFSHVDAQCYQQFLDAFSAQYADSLNILQVDISTAGDASKASVSSPVLVDNGAFHKAKDLCIEE